MAIIRDNNPAHILFGTADGDTIFGNGGNDTIYGGEGNDRIVGGSGADYAHGGAGDDTFVFFNQSDVGVGETISGGTGIDTLLLSSAGSTNALQFDFHHASLWSIERLQLTSGVNDITVNFYLDPLHPTRISPRLEFVGGVGKNAVNFYLGKGASLDLRGATFTNWQADDKVKIFVEDHYCTIHGTSQSDDIWISFGPQNLIEGHGGDDVFYDSISVGGTVDGGAGRDTLVLDSFVYYSSADSGVGSGLRDRILDFSSGDKIDLSALDASATLANDQAFVLDTDGVLSEGKSSSWVCLTR